MKKILFVITQAEFGGAQRYVFDLATSLMDRYEVSVAAGSSDGATELFDRLVDAGIPVHRLKYLIRTINPWQDFKAITELANLYQQLNPDIVHLNSSKAGVIGSIAAKKSKISKTVYTAHGFAFNEPGNILRRLAYLLAEKLSSKYKDVIICVSKLDAHSAYSVRIAPAEKLITIHNGINTQEKNSTHISRAEARKELIGQKDESNYPLIGIVANFYATKDLPNFVEAIATLRDHYRIKTKAVIIGGGDEAKALDLKAIIDHHKLHADITLAGVKKNPAGLMAGLDLYVCSSIKEGFPYSILDAMSAGLPIVSTDVGGIPEMIEHNKSGLLVAPDHPRPLAKAMSELLNYPARARQLGFNARERVSEEFTLKQMIKQTERIYLQS